MSPATPNDPQAQRRSNVRLGLILASIALTFFVGFVVKTMLFGSN
ncbi:MAG: cytochrome oxidase small assembly protein [Aquabacterium sp.]